MHFASRKKFCISTITNAADVGLILMEVSLGPSVVGMTNFFGDPKDRS